MPNPIAKKDVIRAQQILRILGESLELRDEEFATLVIANETKDHFKVLVMTILTQNCTDIAALRAYRRLDQNVGVSVENLSSVSAKRIERSIRVAGLYKQKANGIRNLARIVKEQYSSNLDDLFKGNLDEARSELQGLPQVGPKTADVVLSVFGRPTISVDTHVNRVSKRLGLAESRANYERTRASLMQAFKEEDYRSVPLLFMTHGRRICKAQRPLCPTCPVASLCPYPSKTKRLRVHAS